MTEARKGMRIFSGVQPSGAQVHIGNYLGAMKRFVTLSREQETLFCVVDLHALTTVNNAENLRQHTLSLTAAYLAIGIDPERAILFRQSDVPAVCELAWYLACQFPLGLLERAHAVKDARAKDLPLNSGTMYYPILMAADILLYKGTHVPVGADQKQHLEMSREIAQKFNNSYGEIFPVPEQLIDDNVSAIVGLDGRKMSKSYNNYIGLFEETKVIKKKVMSIVTDSKTVDDPKDPETCNVFALYKLFAREVELADLAEKYRAGGVGYGYSKGLLLEAIERVVAPLRERYQALITRPDTLRDHLVVGAKRAQEIASATIDEVRRAVGVR